MSNERARLAESFNQVAISAEEARKGLLKKEEEAGQVMRIVDELTNNVTELRKQVLQFNGRSSK